jgi:Poly(ADP-ribose) polymerase catalytic domain
MGYDGCIDCNEKKVADWICGTCMFENDPQKDSHCVMCGDGTCTTSASGMAIANESKCGLPGCVNPATYLGFCKKEHLDKAVSRGMLPPMNDSVDRILQDPTGDFTAHLLTNRHSKYVKIKEQFLGAWKHQEKSQPRIERIFWIRVKNDVHRAYQGTVKTIGNVKRRFHGTSQAPQCQFGTNPGVTPCSNPQCNVCSICRQSFKVSRAGGGGGQVMHLRYGAGLYFSDVSSKSDDYNGESARIARDGRTWKCMFLCNVAVGRGYVTQEGRLSPDMCPPSGHHSVVGEPGKDLCYGEVVVYRETQACPAYLIVYSTN